VLRTGVDIPGLIELHNHLSFNALPLWAPVPRVFGNWGRADHHDYCRLVSGPMTVRENPALLPALVRYVESKCLLAGVTTSQGIRLNSNAGVSRYYAGIVRNVEQTKETALPEARTRIEDVDAGSAQSFRQTLVESQGTRCVLLHLSEGVTKPSQPLATARKHFLALEVAPGDWAITDALAGIHAAGLLPPDFDLLAARGGSMVWSPLSNLLLYGETSRIEEAQRAGVKIGLGATGRRPAARTCSGAEGGVALQPARPGWPAERPRPGGDGDDDAARIPERRPGASRPASGRPAGRRRNGRRPVRTLIRATEASVRLVLIGGTRAAASGS
jgi:hypothetical protein